MICPGGGPGADARPRVAQELAQEARVAQELAQEARVAQESAQELRGQGCPGPGPGADGPGLPRSWPRSLG